MKVNIICSKKLIYNGGVMKKLLIIMFILTIASLNAKTNEITFERFHVVPANLLETNSVVDYMIGAFSGFPIRIHEDHISQGGIYFTVTTQNAGARRKQRWLFTDRNMGPVDRGVLHSQTVFSEGMGTVALDPQSGNPFFVWHSPSYEAGAPLNIFNTHFTNDAFSFMHIPGQVINAPAAVKDNVADKPKDGFEYNWPVVYVGPSPESGHNRVYVFQKNYGNSKQPNVNSPEGFTPSSASIISFLDYTTEDIETNKVRDRVWTHREVPYFLAMHDWDGTGGSGQDENIARASWAFTVSPHDGSIAIAGTLVSRSESEAWTKDLGLERHDTFVILCKDYAEGDFEHYTHFFGNSYPDGKNPSWNREGITNSTTLEDMDTGEENLFGGGSDFRMSPNTLHHNIAFDRKGRVHLPVNFRINYLTDGGVATLLNMNSVHKILFDPAAEQPFSILHIDPKPIADFPDKVPFTWDLDDDGYLDLHVDDEGNITDYYPWIMPIFHHNARNYFHYSQMRITEDTNGVMAMMWMDASKASRNQSSPSYYPEFASTPEIMIKISMDSGTNWSETFRMNAKDFPQLGTIPSFVYPADKVLRVDKDIVRLYFMYTDHTAWGTAEFEEDITSASIRIMLTAVDFKTSELINTRDEVIERQSSILSQNFPNPFNPSTTIKFTLPANSDVSLNVYNTRGQLVRNLINDTLPGGEHSVVWNGLDTHGRTSASGMYFYRIEASGVSETRRMVLLK